MLVVIAPAADDSLPVRLPFEGEHAGQQVGPAVDRGHRDAVQRIRIGVMGLEGVTFTDFQDPVPGHRGGGFLQGNRQRQVGAGAVRQDQDPFGIHQDTGRIADLQGDRLGDLDLGRGRCAAIEDPKCSVVAATVDRVVPADLVAGPRVRTAPRERLAGGENRSRAGQGERLSAEIEDSVAVQVFGRCAGSIAIADADITVIGGTATGFPQGRAADRGYRAGAGGVTPVISVAETDGSRVEIAGIADPGVQPEIAVGVLRSVVISEGRISGNVDGPGADLGGVDVDRLERILVVERSCRRIGLSPGAVIDVAVIMDAGGRNQFQIEVVDQDPARTGIGRIHPDQGAAQLTVRFEQFEILLHRGPGEYRFAGGQVIEDDQAAGRLFRGSGAYQWVYTGIRVVHQGQALRQDRPAASLLVVADHPDVGAERGRTHEGSAAVGRGDQIRFLRRGDSRDIHVVGHHHQHRLDQGAGYRGNGVAGIDLPGRVKAVGEILADHRSHGGGGGGGIAGPGIAVVQDQIAPGVRSLDRSRLVVVLAGQHRQAPGVRTSEHIGIVGADGDQEGRGP